jgi:hypothetical protein
VLNVRLQVPPKGWSCSQVPQTPLAQGGFGHWKSLSWSDVTGLDLWKAGRWECCVFERPTKNHVKLNLGTNKGTPQLSNHGKIVLQARPQLKEIREEMGVLDADFRGAGRPFDTQPVMIKGHTLPVQIPQLSRLPRKSTTCCLLMS